jgi:4'-phosphopantetheinyl transferase
MKPDTAYWSLYSLDWGEEAPPQDFLSPIERQRFERMRFPKRRSEWLRGRWAAKHLLLTCDSTWNQMALDAITIAAEPEGAPYYEIAGQGRIPACLSISHRHQMVLCALAPFKIGVDLEAVEPRSAEFVEDFFTPAEAAVWSGLGEAQRPLWANLAWSAKEAVLKALGKGLRLDTRRVEISPPGRFSTDASLGWQPLGVQYSNEELAAWWQPRGDYVLTLARLDEGGETQLVEVVA